MDNTYIKLKLLTGIKYTIVDKTYVLNSTKLFFLLFFNVDISFNIENRLLRFSVVVFGIIHERAVSLFFLFRPWVLFYVAKKRLYIL